MNVLTYALFSPFVWVIEHKAAYLVAHVLIGLALAWEAWIYAADPRLRVQGHALLQMLLVLACAAALGGLYVCAARIVRVLRYR